MKEPNLSNRKNQSNFIETNWPLLIPPILALVDDSSIPSKIAGCNAVTALLTKVPPILLDRTGLRDVFEDAITPCLLYLPTLTVEKDSVLLLRAAYPALIGLAKSWASPRSGERHAKDRVRAMDRVMRKGILTGYAHAGEYVRIADELCVQMDVLIQEMGIDVVKHLKVNLFLSCCSSQTDPSKVC